MRNEFWSMTITCFSTTWRRFTVEYTEHCNNKTTEEPPGVTPPVNSLDELGECLRTGRVLGQSEGGGEVAAVGCPEDEGKHQPGGNQHPDGGDAGQLVQETLTQKHARHALKHRPKGKLLSPRPKYVASSSDELKALNTQTSLSFYWSVQFVTSNTDIALITAWINTANVSRKFFFG